MAGTDRLAFSGTLDIGGDLNVTGDIVSSGSQNVLVGDAFLDLSSGYLSAVPRSSGFTFNVAAYGSTVGIVSFTAGVVATSAPKFTCASPPSFVVGQIVQISGAGRPGNNGLFIVASIGGPGGLDVTVYGVGGTSVPGYAYFCQSQFTTDTGNTATGTCVALTVLCVANGSDVKDFTGTPLPAGVLAQAYYSPAYVYDFNGGIGAGYTEVGAGSSGVSGISLQSAYNGGNTMVMSSGRQFQVYGDPLTDTGIRFSNLGDSEVQVSGTADLQIGADTGTLSFYRGNATPSPAADWADFTVSGGGAQISFMPSFLRPGDPYTTSVSIADGDLLDFASQNRVVACTSNISGVEPVLDIVSHNSAPNSTSSSRFRNGILSVSGYTFEQMGSVTPVLVGSGAQIVVANDPAVFSGASFIAMDSAGPVEIVGTSNASLYAMDTLPSRFTSAHVNAMNFAEPYNALAMLASTGQVAMATQNPSLSGVGPWGFQIGSTGRITDFTFGSPVTGISLYPTGDVLVNASGAVELQAAGPMQLGNSGASSVTIGSDSGPVYFGGSYSRAASAGVLLPTLGGSSIVPGDLIYISGVPSYGPVAQQADADGTGSRDLAGGALETLYEGGFAESHFATVPGTVTWVNFEGGDAPTADTDAGKPCYLSTTPGKARLSAPVGGRVYRVGLVLGWTADTLGRYKILYLPQYISDLS